jgi:isoprenylcysteine carboxyl methyltransferase (ICMT) family protein YpbQ
MFNVVAKIVFVFFGCKLAFYILSKVEKVFRVRPFNNIIANTSMEWSLPVFKYAVLVLFLFAGIETAWVSSFGQQLLAVGLFLLLFGLSLRICAIIALGPMWSYHVQVLSKHKIVEGGIYRYVKHPAYLGNVHLIGLLLCLGCPITASIASVFVIAFYIIRGTAEERLLANIAEKCL